MFPTRGGGCSRSTVNGRARAVRCCCSGAVAVRCGACAPDEYASGPIAAADASERLQLVHVIGEQAVVADVLGVSLEARALERAQEDGQGVVGLHQWGHT